MEFEAFIMLTTIDLAVYSPLNVHYRLAGKLDSAARSPINLTVCSPALLFKTSHSKINAGQSTRVECWKALSIACFS